MPRDRAAKGDAELGQGQFGSLKVERVHDMLFTTRRAAKDEVMNWIQFYNSKRLHSTLGYLSPMNCERKRLGETEKLAA